MGHVHLELVVGTRVQVTYVEGRTRGGDVGEQCSVLEIHLLERIVWYPYTARKLLEKKSVVISCWAGWYMLVFPDASSSQ